MEEKVPRKTQVLENASTGKRKYWKMQVLENASKENANKENASAGKRKYGKRK